RRTAPRPGAGPGAGLGTCVRRVGAGRRDLAGRSVELAREGPPRAAQASQARLLPSWPLLTTSRAGRRSVRLVTCVITPTMRPVLVRFVSTSVTLSDRKSTR